MKGKIMERNVHRYNILGLMLCLLVVGGCVSRDISDLDRWTQEVLKRPGGRIEPLPEIKPYQAYAYQSAEKDARDPFTAFHQKKPPDDIKEEEDLGLTAEMRREINERHRAVLAQSALDRLRMVGTIENAAEQWAIISDPGNTVHRVRVGNYMGRNIGKIVNIFEDRGELRDIGQGTGGRWEERQAAIVLVEE